MYGVLLILVLVITGGAIAFIGDRLGSKVGKKKLSLFGLRPRHTSIIVTIVTGILITTTTLGVMAAVSKDVESQLAGKNITRLAGPGAYDTSLMIATWELANGMRADGMALATGEGYWDALTGAALCGRNSAILVLADDTHQICLDGVVTANAASITTAFVFGGDKVVTPALETRLASIIGA